MKLQTSRIRSHAFRLAGWTITLLYPGALSVAYVLLTFTSLPTTLADVARPIAILVVGSVVVTIVLAAVLRGRHRGAIAASIVITALSAPFLAVSAAAAGFIVVVVQLARGHWSLQAIRHAPTSRLSRGVAVFAGSYLLVAIGLAAPGALGSIPVVPPTPAHVPESDPPDIYLIVLDGYSRADALRSDFGHDNTQFEAGLGRLGFQVAPESRSNYAHSWVSMTALLHGSHIADVPGLLPAPSAPSDQFRSLMVALNQGEMVNVLRQHGYRIGSIPPPFMSLGLSSADDVIDGGQLTDFEYSLLIHSPLGRLLIETFPNFIADQVRGRFEFAMDQLSDLPAIPGSQPRFVLTHIFSPPHAPLVYGADGEELPLADCVPTTCRLWEFPDAAWAGLSDQITYLNARLLTTLGELVEHDPTAVIILTADHGARRSGNDLAEYFSIFFAARTPGFDVFPDDPDSVNVLRRVADTYLGTELGTLAYESWYSPTLTQPLVLRRFGYGE